MQVYTDVVAKLLELINKWRNYTFITELRFEFSYIFGYHSANMSPHYHLKSSSLSLIMVTIAALSLSACAPRGFNHPAASGPIAIQNRTPMAKRLSPRVLTSEEKQIADKLGYDQKILAQVINALDPEIGIVTAMMDGQFEQPKGEKGAKDIFRGSDITVAPLLEKDLENYRNIVRDFPELKPLIDREISLHQNYRGIFDLSPEGKKLNEADIARSERFAQAVRKCSALIRQEAEDKNLQSETDGYMLVKPPDYTSEADVNKKIAELEIKAKGIVLRDENKPRPVLGLRYKSEGNPLYGMDQRLRHLQQQLEGTGYKTSEVGRNKVEAKTFESRADAEKYLSSYGLTHIDPLVLTEQPAQKTQETYQKDSAPSDKSGNIFKSGNLQKEQPPALLNKVMRFMPGVTMRILPGTKVRKLADNKWELDQPARYEARAPIMNAILMKMPEDDFGLSLIKAEGTNGINYGIDTNKVIAKLKSWHKKYKISVLSATFESMTILFKNPPANPDKLLSEAIEFDPDLNSSGSQEEAKESLAQELKQSRTISFWWD